MSEKSLDIQVAERIPEGGFRIRGLTDDTTYQNLRSFIESLDVPDNEACGRIVQALMDVAVRNDLQTQIALHSIAECVEWPEYNRGDGYWVEASHNAMALVGIGERLRNEDAELARLILGMSLPGRDFIALGMAGNPRLPKEVIQSLATFPDPVKVIAASNEKLDVDDVRAMLESIDNGAWVAALVMGQDGWTWPDWQYAFGQVSTGCPESAAFWEVILTEFAREDRWPWFEDFLVQTEDGFDPDDAEGLFIAFEESPHLNSLGVASGWIPAQIVVAGVVDDDAMLRELAVSAVPEVREAVMANDNASDEVRALAALGR